MMNVARWQGNGTACKREDVFSLFRPKSAPAVVNAYAEADRWVVEAHAPGAVPEDVNAEVVRLHDGSQGLKLAILGRKYNDKKEFRLREAPDAWERVLRLPDGLKGDPEAVLRDGILTLSWARRQDRRRIEVKRGELS